MNKGKHVKEPQGVSMIPKVVPKVEVEKTEPDAYFAYGPSARAAILAAKAAKQAGTITVVDPQTIMRRKAGNLFAEIEGMLDDGVIEFGEWSMFDYLRRNMIPPQIAKILSRRFEPIRDELLLAIEGKDKQVKEGYRHIKGDAILEIAAMYQEFIDDIEKYADVKKKLAAKAKPKKISIEKIIKGVKYAATNEKYKLASIDPAKVVGAQELWTFNPATNVLMVYKAANTSGLTFKGCFVNNINEGMSFGKKLGHGAEVKLRTILESQKISARKFLEGLPGDKIAPARLSGVTVLLKVFAL